MKKIIFLIVFLAFIFIESKAQNIVKGVVLDGNSRLPLKNVIISIKENTLIRKITNKNGAFILKGLSNRKYILEIKLKGYELQNFPINLNGQTIDLEEIFLFPDINEDQDLSLITITDDELNDDANAADNISGLLQASKDIFLRTAAFEFSASFFRMKGLDSKNGKILINGIEMNKINDGRAQWSNWGGLNDVLRNQEFSNGLAPSSYTFGGVLGATNMNTRASLQRAGSRISYASSNRSYQHRIMATHTTTLSDNGWAFTFSGSKRHGKEGFSDGTTYNAYSFFTSIEKKLSENHSINFTSIFASNRRGKSSPVNDEVINLKNIAYNEYWGYLNGKRINSRIKEVIEPIFMLNHFWDISSKTSIQTNVSYQTGKIGNSRIDFNGGTNPNPTYYQHLPSFFLSRDQKARAYDAQKYFINDGQLDWENLFRSNITRAESGSFCAFVLYEDRNDETQFTANSILNTELNNNITIDAKIAYKTSNTNNFGEIIDLLGGLGYLDINNFADQDTQDNNILTPNRVVGVGDKFRYNYTIYSDVISSFAQAQFKYNKIDFYTAVNFSKTSYQREGLYQNGRFADTSLGNSEKLDFTNYGIKAGTTYKISGRHLIDFNASYLTNAPTIRNSFSNVRENNNIVENLKSEKIIITDFSYIIRTSIITSKVTAYYTNIKDATEISFYFADGVGGDNTAFVQEILSGIEREHIGVELGIEAQVTPTIKLKGAASLGQFVYANNPNLYLTSDVVDEGIFDSNGRSGDFTSNLKNYKIAAGPQQAYSVGFEYRDPEYWWFGATANFFDNIYIDVAPLTRSENFYRDTDELPFADYNPELAEKLLQQERFNNYMVINMVGGKSWRIGNRFISVFATVNNLLNKEYKSGGFEQGRNANYRELSNDKALDIPVFGNKYWHGRGITYFLNVNLSF